MPSSTTETVLITTVTRNGLIARQGAQSGALIFPMPTSLPVGSTVVANRVYEYNSTQAVVDDWGDGTDVAIGVEAALQHLNKIKVIAVGTATGSPFTFTTGTAVAVDASNDVGMIPITVANMPITSITSVARDTTVLTDIIYTGGDPTALTLSAAQFAVNLSTGAWKLGTSTTGSGAGLVVVYATHNYATALEELAKEGFEYVTAPNKTFSAATFGIFSELVDFATAENKVVAVALASGAVPEVRAAVGDTLGPAIRAIRTGRVKFLASKSYSGGDLTSAFMAATAAMDPAGTSKEQDAPLGVTYADGYSFVEFGGEVAPSVGTWHEMGVNAVYKTPQGGYLITNDRASTLLTNFYRFHSTQRVVRIITNEVQEDLLALRRASPVSIPFDDSGLNAIRETIRATLDRQLRKGYTTSHSVSVPTYAETTAEERQLRQLTGVSYGVVLRGQIHVIEITQEVSL